MTLRSAPEPAPEPEDEEIPSRPRSLLRLALPFGEGALGGAVVGVVVAFFLSGIPETDEQRLLVSAVAFVATIGSSVVVGLFSLIWLILGRSPGAAMVLGFTVLLPLSSIATGLVLWH